MAIPDCPRIIFNDDTCSLRLIEPPHSPAQIENAYTYLKDTQVDWVLWCMSTGDIAYSYYSRIAENAYDLSHLTPPAEGVYGKTPERNLLLSLHQQGIDYLPLLINEFHRRDKGFFASFRMNDCHQKSDPEGFLAGKFWQENQHMRLWDVLDGASYYNAALDYSFKEVRDRRFGVIKEVVERYDVDGVEIDFKRNDFTFPKGTGWQRRGVLTSFYGRVRRLLDRVGKKRGRRLRLITRVPVYEKRLRECGMDVAQWLKRRLIDVLVMSDHACDFNLEFTKYRDLAHQHGVLFYNSLEYGMRLNTSCDTWLPRYVKRPLHSAHTLDPPEQLIRRNRAYAQNSLAQGCDGIYMFNYPCALFEQKPSQTDFGRLTRGLLGELGSQETLRGRRKEYVYWGKLPIWVETLRPAEFYQTIDFKLHDPDVGGPAPVAYLSWRQIAEVNPHASVPYEQSPWVPKGHMQVYLNERLLDEEDFRKERQPAGEIPSQFVIGEHELVTVEVDSGWLTNGANRISFSVPTFPRNDDPYIFIYEFTVVIPGSLE
ncbi:MAG: hypothetical protein KAI66_08390 [Lentisphaeria bacterium]|nr:hypothetical protein [Lentisphaeria bacterium]